MSEYGSESEESISSVSTVDNVNFEQELEANNAGQQRHGLVGAVALDIEDEPGLDLAEPYEDEPLADDEWLQQYNREIQVANEEEARLQRRLDGDDIVGNWTRSERYAQRSTIGYIRVGSNVWAKSFNGDYYRGQVTALADKVYIKFENGDTIAHDRSDGDSIVFDMDPNPSEITVGTKVIAHWSGLAAMLSGVVDRLEGQKYFVLYDDGDKAYNTIQQIRILKPPLYFGPGSGTSRVQKRLSMKATSLMGEGRMSSSGDDNLSPGGPNNRGMSVAADIAPNRRRLHARNDKTSVKSNKSDTSEVFFSKFDDIDSSAKSRPVENRGDPNSNGRTNGFNDESRQEFRSGDQKWYTHVGRSEVVEEQRSNQREEKPNATHKYKVVQRSTFSETSTSQQQFRGNQRAEPAFVTEL